MQFLLPNSKVMVKYVDDKPVSIEVPATIDLTVTDTPPSLKGATATNQYKEATLETGLKVGGPAVHRPRREDPHRHPHRRVRRTRQVNSEANSPPARPPEACRRSMLDHRLRTMFAAVDARANVVLRRSCNVPCWAARIVGERVRGLLDGRRLSRPNAIGSA